MNMNARTYAPLPETPAFLASGLEPLKRARDRLAPAFRALADLERLASPNTQKKIRALARQLRDVEPSMTFIGQIKSGKTTLINAIIGQEGLLPADVNPWTSVVTTLRLTPRAIDPPTSATFDFFDDGEWDRLMKSGGRIGELANRAGADEQLAKVRAQIEEMREKSKRRLGRKFELLLGQSHQYGYFDKELIERYVCLGDDFGEDVDLSDQTGRFADITKSAQLRMRANFAPLAMSIRDTPGINDTFLMREQITLQSIRESRICVVVLSAHQALSSDDLALIRLISNAKSRDVVIFVNRIDELERPLQQVEQIKESIRDTLLKHRAPVGVELVFGSALWATAAVKGDIGFLPKASKAALLNWAESAENRPPASLSPIEMLWFLSGAPKLSQIVSERMCATVLQEATVDVIRQARNVSNALKAQDNFAAKSKLGSTDIKVGLADLAGQLDEIKVNCLNAFKQATDTNFEEFSNRLNRAADGFLNRATASLIEHLEQFGEQETWMYDPTGLRVLLGSAYRSFERAYLNSHAELVGQAAVQISQLLQTALGAESSVIDIEPPAPIRIPPPIAIGQTIALDLQSSWWKSWWIRKRGYGSHSETFRKLIEAEIRPLLDTLKQDVETDVLKAGMRSLASFFSDQQQLWKDVAEKSTLSQNDISSILDLPTLEKRDAMLKRVAQNLDLAS